MLHPSSDISHRTELSDEVPSYLKTTYFGRSIEAYTTTSSTNDIARRRLAEGVSEGHVVLTEDQTAGRGRLGRRWVAERGKNLLFSLVLRPGFDSRQIIPLAAGIALCRALDEVLLATRARIKWPNDVLLEEAKCCGLLVERVNHPVDGLVLGIGVNVNQTEFPAEAGPRPTSLWLAGGRAVPRAPLLARILGHLESVYERLRAGDAEPILEEFERRMHGIGERGTVRATSDGLEVDGVILGVSSDGALRLRTSRGIEHFYAGDVTLRNEASR